jgi:hypothetical protein
MRTAPRWSIGWSTVRLIAALLILAAIVAQAMRSIGGAISRNGDVATTGVNFFSFFTVLSNAGSVVVLSIVGMWGLRHWREGRPLPFGPATALACVTTYMIVTGVVYNTLLRGIELPQGTTVPWSNEVLHVIGPIFLLLDVLFGSSPARLPWRAVLGILVFPLLWVAYTLIRGPRVTNPTTGAAWWYPYPFLDPHVVSGYTGVVPYVLGIAAALAAFGAGVVYVGRRRTSGAALEAGSISQADPAR